MKNKHGHTVVPTDLVAPLIREWAQRNGYETGSQHGFIEDVTGAITALSFRSGVSIRRISDILSDRENSQQYASFDTVDKILVAMGMPGEWHHSLKDHYGPLEAAPYERHLVASSGLEAVA
jgi:hypothetical protein